MPWGHWAFQADPPESGCAALPADVPASVSPQKSALIVRGPREVKKRELVFLQFRLNQSSEDFSAIDYLLFSSFQEFLRRWPSQLRSVHSSLAQPRGGGGRRAGGGRRLAGQQALRTAEAQRSLLPRGLQGPGPALRWAATPSPFGNAEAELGGGGWEASWRCQQGDQLKQGLERVGPRWTLMTWTFLCPQPRQGGLHAGL